MNQKLNPVTGQLDLTTEDAKYQEGRYQSPTCYAIKNPAFSETSLEPIGLTEEPLTYIFAGHIALFIGDKRFMKSNYDPASVVKIASIEETNEDWGSGPDQPVTKITVVEQSFDGYDENPPFFFQIGYESTGSHAEGENTTASYPNAHSEGKDTTAAGSAAHAEGKETEANGICSHSEGFSTKAVGNYSHAEGYLSEAKGKISHAKGYECSSNGEGSYSEGYKCVSNGMYSHAEGAQTAANGDHSHSEGLYSIAENEGCHVGGIGSNINDRPSAKGLASFAHQQVTSGKGKKAADGDNSAILGGRNNSTTTTAVRSVVLGGEDIEANLPDTVFVDSLKLKPRTLPTGLNSTHAGLICFDSADSKLKCWNGSTWNALF